MAWEKGRYYTRSKKVNGRVIREYVGTGIVAQLAAETDELLREKRRFRQAEDKAKRDQLAALDASVDEFDALADRLARAALLAAGFQQHKRGEWRKRRGGNEETASEDARPK